MSSTNSSNTTNTASTGDTVMSFGVPAGPAVETVNAIAESTQQVASDGTNKSMLLVMAAQLETMQNTAMTPPTSVKSGGFSTPCAVPSLRTALESVPTDSQGRAKSPRTDTGDTLVRTPKRQNVSTPRERAAMQELDEWRRRAIEMERKAMSFAGRAIALEDYAARLEQTCRANSSNGSQLENAVTVINKLQADNSQILAGLHEYAQRIQASQGQNLSLEAQLAEASHHRQHLHGQCLELQDLNEQLQQQLSCVVQRGQQVEEQCRQMYGAGKLWEEAANTQIKALQEDCGAKMKEIETWKAKFENQECKKCLELGTKTIEQFNRIKELEDNMAGLETQCQRQVNIANEERKRSASFLKDMTDLQAQVQALVDENELLKANGNSKDDSGRGSGLDMSKDEEVTLLRDQVDRLQYEIDEADRENARLNRLKTNCENQLPELSKQNRDLKEKLMHLLQTPWKEWEETGDGSTYDQCGHCAEPDGGPTDEEPSDDDEEESSEDEEPEYVKVEPKKDNIDLKSSLKPPPNPAVDVASNMLSQQPSDGISDSFKDITRGLKAYKAFPFPNQTTAVKMHEYMAELNENVGASTQYDDELEILWMRTVLLMTTTRESLLKLSNPYYIFDGEKEYCLSEKEHKGRWPDLDRKFAAVTKTYNSAVKRRHKEFRNELYEETNKWPSGRQKFFLIFEYLDTDDSILNTFNINTISELTWFGDLEDDMRKWMNVTEILIKSCRKTIKPETAEDTIRRVVEGCMKTSNDSDIKLSMNRYRTEREEDKGKYDTNWLLARVRQRIKQYEKDRNEDELKRSMAKLVNPKEHKKDKKQKKGPAAPAITDDEGEGKKKKKNKKKKKEDAAPATDGGAKGKGKGKGKGKDTGQGKGKADDKAEEERKKVMELYKLADGRSACHDFQFGKCTRGKDCIFAHDMLPESKKKKLPARPPSRARSNSRPRGKSGGKGKEGQQRKGRQGSKRAVARSRGQGCRKRKEIACILHAVEKRTKMHIQGENRKGMQASPHISGSVGQGVCAP